MQGRKRLTKLEELAERIHRLLQDLRGGAGIDPKPLNGNEADLLTEKRKKKVRLVVCIKRSKTKVEMRTSVSSSSQKSISASSPSSAMAGGAMWANFVIMQATSRFACRESRDWFKRDLNSGATYPDTHTQRRIA